MTPDRLVDLELFLRVQGGMGCHHHNHSPFLMVHYLLQMVLHVCLSTSTRYLQAQAVKAPGNLNNSHSLNSNLSSRILMCRRVIFMLVLLVRGMLLGEAVLVVTLLGLLLGLVLVVQVVVVFIHTPSQGLLLGQLVHRHKVLHKLHLMQEQQQQQLRLQQRRQQRLGQPL